MRADGDAVAVIVGNLLGNALVHAPGALVTVDVEVTDGSPSPSATTDRA